MFGDECVSDPDISQLTCMNNIQKKENWKQNQNGENLRSSKNREQINSDLETSKLSKNKQVITI